MTDKTTDEFWKLYGDELCEQLCEQTCNPDEKMYPHISVISYDRFDAINIRVFAEVTLPDQEPFGVVYESGNWNGFMVSSFGPDAEPEEYRPSIPMYVPAYDALIWYWVNLRDITEKAIAYSHDQYVTGGQLGLRKHYEDWGRKNNLRFESFDDYDRFKLDNIDIIYSALSRKYSAVFANTKLSNISLQKISGPTWTLHRQIQNITSNFVYHRATDRHPNCKIVGSKDGSQFFLNGNRKDFEDEAAIAVLEFL